MRGVSDVDARGVHLVVEDLVRLDEPFVEDHVPHLCI